MDEGEQGEPSATLHFEVGLLEEHEHVADFVGPSEGPCVDRIASMIGRDRNHPSVLIWSLGIRVVPSGLIRTIRY